MVIRLARPPLTALAALIFALLLAFSVAAKPPPRTPPPLHPRPPSPRLPLQPIRPPQPTLLPPPLRNTHPSKKRRALNLGKKVGLSFAGIAVIMQFLVFGFLIYKRMQLFKVRD